MKRGDVSFTFLNRIEEVELNIKDERWQSALALALTLPDICGGIAFPDIVKRYRDGRVMLDRQKNPTRDIEKDYQIQKTDGKLTVLSFPIQPEVLRNAVKLYLM